jgi:hypothetical protein
MPAYESREDDRSRREADQATLMRILWEAGIPTTPDYRGGLHIHPDNRKKASEAIDRWARREVAELKEPSP